MGYLCMRWDTCGTSTSIRRQQEYLGNVCVHVVVLLPLFCSCVNIEACTRTKVVRVILALNRNLNSSMIHFSKWDPLDHLRSCRCVREDNSQPMLGRLACKVRFRSRVLVCARQPGEVVEDLQRSTYIFNLFQKNSQEGEVLCATWVWAGRPRRSFRTDWPRSSVTTAS